MKILIVGGYGFVGSYVAERFAREGVSVIVIDNLSTDRTQKLDFKHRYYNLDVCDKKCAEIFKAHAIDVVIHLAGSNREVDWNSNPDIGQTNEIVGLNNILELSTKYGVKKFIYASDVAIYGRECIIPVSEDDNPEPSTISEITKYFGEMYCNSAGRQKNMQILSLRMSKVYGPGQGVYGSSGVISEIIEKVFKGSEITAIEKDVFDYIYVADVAEAVYLAAYTTCSGVLNLSSNIGYSHHEIVNAIRNFVSTGKSTGIKRGKIPNNGLCVDNSRAKSLLDWVPLYSIEEGIEKSVEWYRKYFELICSKDEVDEVRKSRFIDRYDWRGMIPYVENFCGFLFVWFLNHYTKENMNVSLLDFRLIYIIVMGILYGTKQSSIATGLSIIMFVVSYVSDGGDIISMFYDANSILQVGFYVFAGLLSGYFIDRKNREIASKDIEQKNLEDKIRFLYEMYTENKLVKEELQNQIVNYEDSFGKIYQTVRKLENLDSDMVIYSALKVVENMIKSNQVSIYLVDEKRRDCLRLFSKSELLEIPNTIFTSLWPGLRDCVTSKEIFVNRKLIDGYPMMVAPIVIGSDVYAIIMLHKIEFEKLTLQIENLFKVLSELISSSLARALKFEEATVKERFMEDTFILTQQSFGDVFQKRKKLTKRDKLSLSLIEITRHDKDLKKVSGKISDSFRTVDKIGISKDGKLLVLLQNCDELKSKIVIERLGKSGVEAEFVQRVV